MNELDTTDLSPSTRGRAARARNDDKGRSPFWPLLLLGAAVLLVLVKGTYAEYQQHQFLAEQLASPQRILAVETTRQNIERLRVALLTLARTNADAQQLVDRFGLAPVAPVTTPPAALPPPPQTP